MAAPSAGVSFYFFDFDDNIMTLATQILLLNTATREEHPISTQDLPTIQPLLGKPGKWENFSIVEDRTFRNFRDLSPAELQPGQRQNFVEDVAKTIGVGSPPWQGPSWRLFVHACNAARPLSIITARGHSRETLKQGVRLLVEAGLIRQEPNYHTIFPVGNPEVRRELGDCSLDMTTPLLKRRAIIASVEKAVENDAAQADLRFGMSDDDPQNVNLIVRAMCECKKKYPTKRFFAINTHMQEEVKLEVYPVDYPVTHKPEDGPRDVF